MLKSYSAHQEDKKVIKALKIIGNRNLNKECCEFGAWDGKFLSNTFILIKKKKFSGLLIECDKERYIDLCNNLPEERVKKLNTFINNKGKNSLDYFIKTKKFSKNIDFLSIDIDGNDYHIFKNLNYTKPKIICIEYNRTFPIDFEYVQKEDFRVKQGSSACSMLKLAKKKGYFLYDCTPDNLILINEKYKKTFSKLMNFQSVEKKLSNFIVHNSISYGFDNSLITRRPINLYWHSQNNQNLPIKVQILPRFLTRFHDDYNIVQRILFYIFMFFRYPKKYLLNPIKYLKILLFLKRY
tara:strand:+ start:498 stop:1385 length:888 start_codon:yes stop_codon:yes gene_type:complete